MKTVFNGFMLKLLPLLFIAMLGLAPVNAHAATPAGSGTFDCLGDLDWGCRIVGYLFQSTDNQVTYMKDGQPSTESPSFVINGLHAMMRFFSNALLIFASIKLLYELIQMVAETAHTGQVGGKNANKLWAPIRLVVAIGLLVPLSTGLNSGQYIVLQIAKWGSGMASQAWTVFAKSLGGGEVFSKSVTPNINGLSMNAIRTFACMHIMNVYADASGFTHDVVKARDEIIKGADRTVFGNKVEGGNDVCGYFVYPVSLSLASGTPNADVGLGLTIDNAQEFQRASQNMSREVAILTQYFVTTQPPPADAVEPIKLVIENFRKNLETNLENKTKNLSTAEMNKITNQLQRTANDQGWTSAGSWFLAITRIQGALIDGGLTIPKATGPNLEVFERLYESPYRDYVKLVDFMERHFKVSGTNYTTSVGLDPIENSGLGSMPANFIFWTLDKLGAEIGLWDHDPTKAFGDLGGSTNPFAEIAAIGHKKIRMALDILGWAITGQVVGIAVGSFKNPITKGIGGFMQGLTVFLMMLVSIFMIAGIVLAYIVPMLPFTRFFFSILTWLGSVMEGMILVPFLALAFLTPNGEGFTGQNTRNGFFLVFQIFLRPILCLFGLIGAMILFYIAAKFLNASFYEATRGVASYQGSAMIFMAKVVYGVMYAALLYSAANVSFKMIEHFPQNALRWMGGSASEHQYDDHNTVAGIVGTQLGGQILQNFQKMPEQMTAPITNALKGYNDQASSDSSSQTATTRHNQVLLGQGGSLRPGMEMHEQGAVAMPQGSAMQIQEAEHNLRDANNYQADIDRDAQELQDPYVAPSRRATLEANIQSNVNKLGSIGVIARIPTVPSITGTTNGTTPTRSINDLEARLNDLRNPPP